MKRHKSPCIDKCAFSGPQGWCVACGRTLEECQQWKKMKAYDRNILEKNLVKRMAQM
ncbi:MAG: DUF1289 domain-containing protein [Campylobacterota bacterium]|nr:DUF1289 domain-containing protein [Campylobacterota bacterium]